MAEGLEYFDDDSKEFQKTVKKTNGKNPNFG